MERLFDGIDLEKVSTSMTINATASILLALYIAVAQAHTARDVKKLSGTIQNDVLKEYIARGTYIYPPAAAMRIITDIFAYCQRARAGVEHHLHLAATTCARRDRPRCRRWRSPWPTA